MKKKLEAELISIAHRILQLKNKSDIIAIHQETQKLYEKLSVLRFVEESFGDVKPTIGSGEFSHKLDSYFSDEPISQEAGPENPTIEANQGVSEDQNNKEISPDTETFEQASKDESENTASANDDVASDESSATSEMNDDESDEILAETEQEPTQHEQKISEESSDKNSSEDDVEIPLDVPPTINEPETEVELEVAKADAEKDMTKTSDEPKEEMFIPSFELAFDPKTDDIDKIEKIASPQFSFDDLLGKDYSDPVFEKLTETERKEHPKSIEPAASTTSSTPRSVSLNDHLSKGITIGLNDRIAFIKHLFGDSSEDYNRVLSQLMTFGTFDEAQSFIDDMVKPDYNDWKGKEEYAERFMDIVQRRFL